MMSRCLQRCAVTLFAFGSLFLTISVLMTSDSGLGQDPTENPVEQPGGGGGTGGNCGPRCDAGFNQGVVCCDWMGLPLGCSNNVNLPQCIANPNAPCSNPNPPAGWTCNRCQCKRINEEVDACECRG